ncbi:MBL fold metallo-hydrolase [Actinoplanes lobatus]|uniref:Glyoxylase-like metal-dependent hydrolase (Beta-lactamase superfamily II)/rhodanese-related sulfurtransferase n=1 Tax=Actinoplanes lobatus TaxID=113568 RepID=A0A7W7HLT3_9ACTN|nr:MBL fold metallo-hydrolase [Actinoplanes lobatus]MBB4752831.1 glyoxylase-like metal-dependent hydrolase (beta-lactamase superfamily II)/rhodanese-related sulfurtransferase [Actinoplanes lobatus]GGN88412.1 MBL fold metallo-hydrolase [Actinoplanes lobatus]GIE39441.1 MBL fold metallo-hydrolase [Actinoplanes lobatus]
MTELSVEVVQTSSLGDRSYLAHDGQVALVVDPQRDIDRILALAGRLGVRITHVAETHLHNDYVSGGLALARLTGATYLVAADDEVGFDRRPVTDGDEIAISAGIRLRVVATPGHTFHHLSYVLDGDDGPAGVFTGGSLLFGTTGRTDLLGRQHAHTLAEHQHASARRLADLLPEGAQVWPTHGFGSFCSATQSDAPESTIGRERIANPALRLETGDFVRETLAGLDAYPAYYAHMGARNTAGADLIDLTAVAVADPAELAARIADGEWVVDLRSRKAFAHRHLTGTLSFGLDGPMSTWLAWMAPWGAPITLLGDDPEQVADAQRELARIGIDRPAAAATGSPEQWAGGDGTRLTRLTTATFTDLAAARTGTPPHGLPAVDVLLDVRMTNEWRTHHIDGAVHIPLPDLPGRLHTVPPGTVWVHCGSGYRAAAAGSLLQRAGRQVVHIDDAYADAANAGLSIVSGH